MSAMSASSAAPAGLMPLSLIAEHKSAQPPPAVQNLPRSGSDKCVPPGSVPKPTANGMEGPGPLPLVSQLPQTATAIAELTTSQHNTSSATNSEVGVQPPNPHSYQTSLQNMVKTSDTGPVQEGIGASFNVGSGIVTTVTGERRHTEEVTIQHHQMSSTTTTSTFSSMSSTTTVDHSRSTITAQLLQLQPSQQITHQTSPGVVSLDNTSSKISTAAAGITPINASENPGSTASTQPVSSAVPVLEESSTRTQESSITQTVETTTTALRQPAPEENASTLPTSSQPEVLGQTQSDPSQLVTPGVTSTKISHQIPQTNSGNVDNPSTTAASQQPTSHSESTASANTQAQSSNEHPTSNAAISPRQPSKRTSKAPPTSISSSVETSKKSAGTESSKEKENNATPGDKPRRRRLPTQPYQSPIPELNIMAKYKKMKEMNEKEKVEKKPSISSSDKLIVFYRNEFLAVRNAEGGFYVCQAMQNVYKTSSRIRIRWLSQQSDPATDLYTPDFYDHTEFDCILTNLNLERVEKDKFRLPEPESRRTESILQRALDVERGVAPPPADDTLTETHPDGLDLSLYRNEEQLKKRKKNKKKAGRKKELISEEANKRSKSSTRRKGVTGGSSSISAAAVAKAKKAAAIKRTAAKRVVQQAAAAKRQSSNSVSSIVHIKKTSTAILPNKTSPANTAISKKETKVNSSIALGKRKTSAVSQGVSATPEKRTRRGVPSQQLHTPSQNTTSTVQSKSKGSLTSSTTSSNVKNVTSNNSSGGNNAVGGGSNGATAGSARRTLRNSK